MKQLFTLLIVITICLSLCACQTKCDKHAYGEWSIKTPATCSSAGVETRKCNSCDATEDREIKAAGHTYGEWSIKTAATCSSAGIETRKCNNCDATEDREKAISHTYGEWSIKTANTCSESGIETRKCNNCDTTEDREIKATGHQYDGLYCKYCDACSVMMCEIGKPYTDKNGLTVILNSYSVSETDGYYSYTINYTIRNEVKDSKLMPGSFKLFFTDSTGEPQYGGFDYLFYGEKSNRSYTWKVLKSQTVLVLEYNADETDAGLDGAFFRDEPIYDTQHWATPKI